MLEEITHLDQLEHLGKRLPADVLGRYEPMTGLIVLNMPKASYLKALRRYGEKRGKESDVHLIRALNHETCHFTQCLSTGYMGHRNRVLWRAFNSRLNRVTNWRLGWLLVQSRCRLWVLRLFFLAAQDGRARAHRMAQLMHDHNHMALTHRITNGNQNSIARLNFTHYFDTLDRFRALENEPGPAGISTLGILEGAAVAFCALCEPMFRAPEAFTQRMTEELATLPPVYGELWGALQAQAGDRAPALILPLAALALQYQRPHIAVGPLLAQLLASPPGEEAAFAETLFNAPPKIAGAGKRIKPPQHHRDHKRRARFYDTFIDSLRGDPVGLDDYHLLTDVMYLYRVDSYPICATFSDGKSTGTSMSNEERALRIIIAAQTLEVESRGRDRRDGQKRMIAYFRYAFHRSFGI